jgi:hypothetical protein
MNKDKIIKEYMSKISKEGHKKNPRPREFYVKMRKAWIEKERAK